MRWVNNLNSIKGKLIKLSKLPIERQAKLQMHVVVTISYKKIWFELHGTDVDDFNV